MMPRRYGPPSMRMRMRHGPPPRFVRRMGCAFAAMIVWAAIGAGAIVAWFSHAPQLVWTAPIAIALTIALAVAFALTFGRARAFFAQQDRLRRQLMADVAHELRTPLAVLQGRIEGLIDGVYPRDDAQLAELLADTRYLGRLVEDVRTIANAEAGALDLRKEKVDVEELLRETAKAIGPRVVVDVPDHLPPIDGDPVRLREVLLNLLTNAVEHAPDGDVTMSAESRPGEIVIRVRDRGPGIPPDELAHLFDRFHKGAQSRGTGLGLSIAQRLVTAHGGSIRAESVIGQGTTITVLFPVR